MVQSSMDPAQPVSILLVDEDEISRETIARLVHFKLPQLKLHVSESIVAALEVCEQHRIDIIIVDIATNEHLSCEYIQNVRATNDKIKSILVSSQSPDEIKDIGCINDCSLAQMPIDLAQLLILIQKNVAIIEGSQ